VARRKEIRPCCRSEREEGDEKEEVESGQMKGITEGGAGAGTDAAGATSWSEKKGGKGRMQLKEEGEKKRAGDFVPVKLSFLLPSLLFLSFSEENTGE